MLSNKDFAGFLTQTPSSSSSEKEGKIKFDLKQIATWDKQNEAQLKKKRTIQESSTEAKVKALPHYRDRASERRQDLKSENETAMEDMVAKLDDEETKFLGGDVEHTHFVKGLDYALLRKIRGEVQAIEATLTQKKQQFVEEKPQIHINSQIGLNLKTFIFENYQTNKIRSKSLIKTRTASDLLSRTAFEFDVDIESEMDLPTTISRSKKEIDDEEVYLNYVVPNKLIQQIADVLSKHIHDMSLKSNKRKKQTNGAHEAGDATVARSSHSDYQPAKAKTSVPVFSHDIYDDIGQYIPEEVKDKSGGGGSAAAPATAVRVFTSSSPTCPALTTTATAASLPVRVSVAVTAIGDKSEKRSGSDYVAFDDEEEEGLVNEELDALLTARQQPTSAAAAAPALTAGASTGGSHERSSIIHRDVFSGEMLPLDSLLPPGHAASRHKNIGFGNKVNFLLNASASSGSAVAGSEFENEYDYNPDSMEAEYFYDSDDGEKDTKKPKTSFKPTAKPAAASTSSTPHRNASSTPAHPRDSATAQPNRAQRRAMAKGPNA